MAGMAESSPFSFGVHVADLTAPGGIPAAARAAEEAGFDILTAADHVGHQSPFLSLALAAAATSRVRLRTYVLDVAFWNPGLLARDVATLDAASAGRVDLGLGAGHMRHEHQDVGLAFLPLAQRLAQLEATALEVRDRLAKADHAPAAVQQPVPLVVGAMSGPGLELAARLADVVALSGLLQIPGAPAGTLTLASSRLTDERVAQVRGAAGNRPIVIDALLQHVDVHTDPAGAAAALAARFRGRTSAEVILDSPFVLHAPSVTDAVEQLHRRRERWGITSWCTSPRSGPALAEVVAVTREGGQPPRDARWLTAQDALPTD
jgi:probable F420-dependent oxidoreductase